MNRREIWLINLDPAIGAEIKKTRPGVIVSSDTIGILPLRVIVPLTDWKSHYEPAAWMVKITPHKRSGLLKDSAADTFQIHSISTARFIRKIGEIAPEEMEQIAFAIGLVVEHPALP